VRVIVVVIIDVRMEKRRTHRSHRHRDDQRHGLDASEETPTFHRNR
jgi:hypothetical protein